MALLCVVVAVREGVGEDGVGAVGHTSEERPIKRGRERGAEYKED